MPDLDVISALLDSGTPLVRMVHDHDIYCMRSYKYNYFNRQICTRAASLYCVFGCLACVVKNNDPGFPLKWVSLRVWRVVIPPSSLSGWDRNNQELRE